MQFFRDLLTFSKNKRPWHFPLISALCVGIPAFIAALMDSFNEGMLIAIGALVTVYMPNTRIAPRMVTICLCSFGFLFCFTLGSIASILAWLPPLVLMFTAFLVILITRYYKLAPPGSFFFIVITTVSMTIPHDLRTLPLNVGLVAMGGMLACVACFVYSLIVGANTLPHIELPTDERVNAIMLEAMFVSACIGGAYALALVIQLNNPYWVPISCAAILQGATFRQVWHRNVHRIFGTLIGMLLAWAIFHFHPSAWALALLLFALQFISESVVSRHYGLAIVFVTPLTVIMAEVAGPTAPIDSLLQYRVFDIILGSSMGLLGGALFHKTKWKQLEERMDNRKKLSDLL